MKLFSKKEQKSAFDAYIKDLEKWVEMGVAPLPPATNSDMTADELRRAEAIYKEVAKGKNG